MRRKRQDWPCAVFRKIELKTRRHSAIFVHMSGSGCLFRSGRTGTREHSKMVFDHDAILGVIWVMVSGQAACREVSQTARGLRRERRKAGREQ
jgi:hypothetical protein